MAKTATFIHPLSYPLVQYPICFLDYLWVITIYVICGFYLAVLIDGTILPPFKLEIESTYSSNYLFLLVFLQLGVQGFIAILLAAALQMVPSPVNNVCGYHYESSLGALIRNPALVSVMLLTLSLSLRQRMLYLFSRFVNTDEQKNINITLGTN